MLNKNIREFTRQIHIDTYLLDGFTRRLYPNILFYRRWPLFLSLSLSLSSPAFRLIMQSSLVYLSSTIIEVVKPFQVSINAYTLLFFSFFSFLLFHFLFSFLLQLSSQLSLPLLLSSNDNTRTYIFTFESIVDRFQESSLIRFTQKIRFKLVETDKLWI